MPSVRRRLTLVLTAGFVLLTAAAGVCVERAVADHATGELDAALLAKARAFVVLTEQEGETIQLDYEPQALPEYERAERPEYVQFWLDDGSVRFRSGRLGTSDLPLHRPLGAEPWAGDLTLPDGRAGRVLELAFSPRRSAPEGAADGPDPAALGSATAGRTLVVAVARDRRELDALLARTRTALLAIGGAAALLAGLLVWRALARAFRPIEAIASQVAALDADRLGARVDVPGTPRELERIVAQVNALLARLEEAVARERRFTGNVAHELRTPIAELRALAAVGARWPEDPSSVAQFFRDVDAAAVGMERIVADLLLLARCQAGAEPLERRRTSLDGIVEVAASRLAREAEARGLRIDLDVPHGLVLLSDPGKLALVVANLLDNAVSHALPGSEVRCEARRVGTRLRLEVVNRAEPLSPEELARLTEPFWRKDAARASGRHAGLGLALVQALSALLGLRLELAQDPDGRFRARVEGEAVPPPPEPATPPAGRATLPLSRS